MNSQPRKLTLEEEQYEAKKREIRDMVKKFVFLTRDQLIAYNGGDKKTTDMILSQLCKKKEIAVFSRDEYGEPQEYVADKHIDKKTNTRFGYQKAFNIYLALSQVMDIGAFAVGIDDGVIMSFEVNGAIYDIVRIPVGDEDAVPSLLHMNERYLPSKERENFHRIVMLDDEDQLIKGIADITGLEKVLAVDNEGNVKDLKVKATILEGEEKRWFAKD